MTISAYARQWLAAKLVVLACMAHKATVGELAARSAIRMGWWPTDRAPVEQHNFAVELAERIASEDN